MVEREFEVEAQRTDVRQVGLKGLTPEDSTKVGQGIALSVGDVQPESCAQVWACGPSAGSTGFLLGTHTSIVTAIISLGPQSWWSTEAKPILL